MHGREVMRARGARACRLAGRQLYAPTGHEAVVLFAVGQPEHALLRTDKRRDGMMMLCEMGCCLALGGGGGDLVTFVVCDYAVAGGERSQIPEPDQTCVESVSQLSVSE